MLEAVAPTCRQGGVEAIFVMVSAVSGPCAIVNGHAYSLVLKKKRERLALVADTDLIYFR
jgi:hypothetical protein